MARTNIQEQIDQGIQVGVAQVLAAMGIQMPVARVPGERAADYIEFGSDQHRRFLGLVAVSEGDDVEGYITHKSQHSGKTYRLDDELGVVNLYPGVDPDKAAILILKMKINDLEMACGDPVAGAPPMWDHGDVMMTFGVPGAYGAMEHAPHTVAR